MPFEKMPIFEPPKQTSETPNELKKEEKSEIFEKKQDISINAEKIKNEEETILAKFRKMPESIKKMIRIFALTTILAQSAVFAEEIKVYGKSRYETTEELQEAKKEATYETQKEYLRQEYLKQVENDYNQAIKDENAFTKDYTFKIKSKKILDNILKIQIDYLKQDLTPTKVKNYQNIQYQFFCDKNGIEKIIYYTDTKVSPENILNDNYRENLQEKFKTMQEIENQSSKIEKLATDLNDYLTLYKHSELKNGKEHPETIYLQNKIQEYQQAIKNIGGDNIFNQNFHNFFENLKK